MTEYFFAFHDYDSQTDGELSFKKGDCIRLLDADSDWWFGESIRTNEKGWVSPSYGQVLENVNPFETFNDKEKLERRKALFVEMIRTEASFVNDLSLFILSIVNPLQTLDTQFKRSFLNEPSIAVSLTLLRDIFSACSSFQSGIQKAGSADSMARCYLEFSPSMQLFAQYVSENASCLNSVKSFSRQLGDFSRESDLPEDMTIESLLVLPLEHYSSYFHQFREFVWLTPTNRPEYKTLSSALDELQEQTEKVDIKLNDIEASVKLLALQNEFVGHPKIFTVTRRLLLEGFVERIRTKSGATTNKRYYAHLFNDSFIWSQRNKEGVYKLVKSLDLNGASLASSNIERFQNCFQLTVNGISEAFRVVDASQYREWFSEIEAVIGSFKAQAVAAVATMDELVIKPPPHQTLGIRCNLLLKFMSGESRVMSLIATLNQFVIKPLLSASKGGELISKSTQQRKGGHKLEENSITKMQQQSVMEALNIPDIQIFLRAAEGLTIGLRDFLENLKALCTSEKWSENIKIGVFFNSTNARLLHSQFKSYAAGLPRCLRILKSPVFMQFYKDSEASLASFPGTFADNLEAPKNRPVIWLDFLTQLNQSSSSFHPDKNDLVQAEASLALVVSEVEGVVKNNRNFEKLLEIQTLLVPPSTGMFSSANGTEEITIFIQRLASTERKFIKEGDLKKICRKTKKVYRFWLFSDFLCYGSSNGNSTFTLHRALDLRLCKVCVHSGEGGKCAFEILGSEKSFIVIANSEQQRNDWMDKINGCCQDQRRSKGMREDSLTLLPVWEQENGNNFCTICKQSFGIFRRRRHCKKCGKMVCESHSQHREVIPHIDKVNKLRICDSCAGLKHPAFDSSKSSNSSSKSFSSARSPKVNNSPVRQTSFSISLDTAPSSGSNGVNKYPMNRLTPSLSLGGTTTASSSSSLSPSQMTPNANSSFRSMSIGGPIQVHVHVPNQSYSVPGSPSSVASAPASFQKGQSTQPLTKLTVAPPKQIQVQQNVRSFSSDNPSTSGIHLKMINPESLRDDRSNSVNSITTPVSGRDVNGNSNKSESKGFGNKVPVNPRLPPTIPRPPPPQSPPKSNQTNGQSSVIPPPPPPPLVGIKEQDSAQPISFVERPSLIERSTPSSPRNLLLETREKLKVRSVAPPPPPSRPPPPPRPPNAPHSQNDQNDQNDFSIKRNGASYLNTDNKWNKDDDFTDDYDGNEEYGGNSNKNRSNVVEGDSKPETNVPRPPPPKNVLQELSADTPSHSPVRHSEDNSHRENGRDENVVKESPVPQKPSFLQALQSGNTNLRKIIRKSIAASTMGQKTAATGNVLSLLADQINKRRMYVKDNSDSESDSDDGFSSDED